MSESSILERIATLVSEEHRIRTHGVRTLDEMQQLRNVSEQLDQCWDLLRQRRAKVEFGADPNSAQVRDVGTVEGYKG